MTSKRDLERRLESLDTVGEHEPGTDCIHPRLIKIVSSEVNNAK